MGNGKPSRLKRAIGKIRMPKGRANMRNLGVGAGVVGAVALSVFLMAVPGSPEERTEKMALSGQQLFESLLERHPAAVNESRVFEGEEHGSSTNRIVLPLTVWDDLSTKQRNSLGSWLNTIGGRWEIRTGTLSDDASRVLDTEAVITSELWNQQVK